MKIHVVRAWIGMLVLLSFTLGAVKAAENDATTTDDLFNGHMWQLLNDSQKTIHLTGIQEGILLCLSQIKEDLLIPPALMRSIQESGLLERRRLLFSGQGVSGIANRMDVFYRDADNLAIPIIEAYRHVTLILNFSDSQDMADDLARLKLKFQN